MRGKFTRTVWNISCKKISADQAAEIRADYERGGVTQQSIGDRFGISQRSVSNIVLRKTWYGILAKNEETAFPQSGTAR